MCVFHLYVSGNAMAINHFITSYGASMKTAVPGNLRYKAFLHATVKLKPGSLEWLQKRTEQIWWAKGELVHLLWGLQISIWEP